MRTVANTDQEFVTAIYKGGGIQANVARILGCSWVTVHERIKKSSLLQEAMERAGEVNLDEAEDLIRENIQIAKYSQKSWDLIHAIEDLPDISDEEKKVLISRVPKKLADTLDARWFLKHKGKHRGYTERTELTGADGVAIDMQVTVVESTKDKDANKD